LFVLKIRTIRTPEQIRTTLVYVYPLFKSMHCVLEITTQLSMDRTSYFCFNFEIRAIYPSLTTFVVNAGINAHKRQCCDAPFYLHER